MSNHDYSTIQLKTRTFLEELEAERAPPINALPYREARAVLDKVQSGPVSRRRQRELSCEGAPAR
jgi:hypothetical protein